jgi:hypothetical protein
MTVRKSRNEVRTLVFGGVVALGTLGVVEVSKVLRAEETAVFAEEVVLQLHTAPVALKVVHLPIASDE